MSTSAEDGVPLRADQEEEEDEAEEEDDAEAEEEEEDEEDGFSGSSFSLDDDDHELLGFADSTRVGEDADSAPAATKHEGSQNSSALSIRNDMRREKSTNLARYSVLSREAIVARQREALNAVQSVTSMLPSDCRVLLKFFKWDVDTCLERWSDDVDGTCRAAGAKPAADGSAEQAPVDVEPGTCSVCFDDELADDDMSTLACGHSFCNDCWKSYLGLQVKEKAADICCPGQLANGEKCPLVVDESLVLRLLPPDERERYFEILLESFVEDNDRVKWCPGPGCNMALVLEASTSDRNEHVRCECSFVTCFRCSLDEPHEPATCDMAKEWLEKTSGRDDTLSEREILQTTKPCPRCGTPIEKNGGCNHMQCVRCRPVYHFCWVCMGKFGKGPSGGNDGYSNHKCDVFSKSDPQVPDSVAEIERFWWFAQRYLTQSDSLMLERALIACSDGVSSSLMDTQRQSREASLFYVRALRQLVDCRRILRWGHCFGYYRPLKRSFVSKLLFEDHMVQLQQHTEMLADIATLHSGQDIDLEESDDAASVGFGGSNELLAHLNDEAIAAALAFDSGEEDGAAARSKKKIRKAAPVRKPARAAGKQEAATDAGLAKLDPEERAKVLAQRLTDVLARHSALLFRRRSDIINQTVIAQRVAYNLLQLAADWNSGDELQNQMTPRQQLALPKAQRKRAAPAEKRTPPKRAPVKRARR